LNFDFDLGFGVSSDEEIKYEEREGLREIRFEQIVYVEYEEREI